ncbi:MAG TPA: glycosyltransferase family 39 protein, partial [Kofleriaceae bacterium]
MTEDREPNVVQRGANQLVLGAADALRDRFWQIGVGVSLALVVVAGFWQRWHVLAVNELPVGIDGYFYPVQVRSLLEHGVLRYPASPVTFYWMTPFALVTDPIVGAKLGAALGGALVAIPAYGVGKILGGHRGAGLVAAVLAATTATSCFLAFEFVKQGIGLTVALAALWAILVAIERRTRRSVVIAAFAIAIAFATHKLAAGLVIAIVLPELAHLARRELFGRRLIYLVLVAIGVALGIVLLGVIAPKRFVSPSDLALVKDLVSSTAHVTAPALVFPDRELHFAYEPLLAGLVCIAALSVAWSRPAVTGPHHRLTAIAICALGILLALPWLSVDDPQGLGFRLRVAAFVPLALGGAIIVGALRHALFGCAIAAVLVAYELPRAYLAGVQPAGVVPTSPVLAGAVANARGKIPEGKTVIVPERHILFMVDWYTRAAVNLRPELVPLSERIRMVGLVWIG